MGCFVAFLSLRLMDRLGLLSICIPDSAYRVIRLNANVVAHSNSHNALNFSIMPSIASISSADTCSAPTISFGNNFTASFIEG
jgi:hypothetical protein